MRERSAGMAVAVILTIQLFASIPTASAQSKDDKPATGSISGVVTFEGKPAKDVGMTLMKLGDGPTDTTAVGRTRTDKDGKFAFDGLAQGRYGLDAYAPGLFTLDSSPHDGALAVSLGDGETVKGVAIALVKGAAITGKLSDEEGNPIASQRIQVYLKRASGQFEQAQVWERTVASDDRGIYRVFGLSPGTYAVAAGTSAEESSMNRGLPIHYEQRFHGGSPTLDGAKEIELASAGEAQGIDIVLKRRADGYTIRGRVINAETGKPVPGAFVRLSFRRAGGFGGSSGGVGASETGEFSVQNVPSGDYGLTALVMASDGGSFISDPVEVTVNDRDVNDIVIELKRAGSVTGVIAPLETEAGLDLSGLGDRSLALVGIIEAGATQTGSRGVPTVMIRVRPDRTFAAVGLRPGSYNVMVGPWAPVKGFHIVRVDVDGVALAGPLRIEGAETIANVRIVIGKAAGIVKGRVVPKNGPLEFGRVGVSAVPAGSDTGSMMQRLDSTGAFLLEGLPPGDAEVKVFYHPGSGKPPITRSKRVSVPVEGTVEMTIEFDLDADPPPQGGGL